MDKRIVIGFALLILFALVATGCQVNSTVAIPRNAQSLQYLLDNSSHLDLQDNGDYSSFEPLHPMLSDYEVFLTGESHGLALNHALELKMLKYLYYHADVRVLLIESGYASAALIDSYIQGGEQSIIDDLFAELKGTYSWTQEQYRRWQELRAWNLNLPLGDRIRVIGIDIDHQSRTAVSFLVKLLPDIAVPDEFEVLTQLRTDLGNDQINTLCVQLQRDLQANADSARAFFKDSLFEFSLVVDNIIACYAAYQGDFNEVREAQIYHNFRIISSRYPEDKYYGQWGAWHIASASSDGVVPMVGRMLADGVRVLPIHLFYQDCTALSKTKNQGYDTMKQENMRLPKATSSAGARIFNLRSAPSDQRPLFRGGKESPDDYPFIILINNSPPSTPLGY